MYYLSFYFDIKVFSIVMGTGGYRRMSSLDVFPYNYAESKRRIFWLPRFAPESARVLIFEGQAHEVSNEGIVLS